MDLSTAVLFGVVGLLALNQVVARVPSLLRRDAVFFSLLVVLLAAGTLILSQGLPGFEDMPAVSFVVGLMFFLHVAQDLALRNRLLARARASAQDAQEARAAALGAQVVDHPSDEA